nr:hypothetical protein [Tanacetum cinerariifolium]
MANPNPEDPNVPNEGVLEEDPHHLLDYDEEEDPEMDIEKEEPEEDSVEEPKPLAKDGDQFDTHPNPQPGNMNGWVDDDDDVEKEEDEENEDADIEEDGDAEIIFPYEVQGDQTPPPRDESSDSDSEPEAEEADDKPKAEDADDELEVEETGVEPKAEGADVELEAEEPDGVPEAVIRAGSQRSFAIRDFPISVYETGESSTARNPQFIGGLAPWALRRDLEALHRHERIREAESETDKADEATEGEKRKGESDRGGRGDNRREHNRRQNQRRGNAGAMTNVAPNNNETCQKCKNKRHAGDCWKCTKCGKLGHRTERCRTSETSCYNFNEKGHRKRDCPKLGRNRQGGNNCRELGSFDVVIGMDWLLKNDAAILCGEKKV